MFSCFARRIHDRWPPTQRSSTAAVRTCGRSERDGRRAAPRGAAALRSVAAEPADSCRRAHRADEQLRVTCMLPVAVHGAGQGCAAQKAAECDPREVRCNVDVHETAQRRFASRFAAGAGLCMTAAASGRAGRTIDTSDRPSSSYTFHSEAQGDSGSPSRQRPWPATALRLLCWPCPALRTVTGEISTCRTLRA